MNTYRLWNLRWNHAGPGTDHEPVPVLEPIMNLYRSWKWYWTHIATRTDIESIPDLVLILNPWIHISPGKKWKTHSKSIKNLKRKLNQYRSNRSWTKSYPKIGPDFNYYNEQFRIRIRNDTWIWCGSETDTIPGRIPVRKCAAKDE